MGPSGSGKSYLACALGMEACKHYYSVKYIRLPELLTELAIARGEGDYGSFMQYRAQISGKMNKDHEKAYLQTRIYEAGTLRASSTWTCMWGTPIAATTQWVDKINNSNYSAKAYGKNFQDTTYFMTSWT